MSVRVNVGEGGADPRIADLLRALAGRVVIVGSLARLDDGVANDIDLLWDFDSDTAREAMTAAIAASGLTYESVGPGCWHFARRDYGVAIDIIPIHRGPPYRTIRRRGRTMRVLGVDLVAAQHADAL